MASVPSKVKTPAKLCTGEKVEEINSGGRYRYYVAKDKELDVDVYKRQDFTLLSIPIFRLICLPVTGRLISELWF